MSNLSGRVCGRMVEVAFVVAGTMLLSPLVAAAEDKSPETVDGIYTLTCGSKIKDEFSEYMSVILDLRHPSLCKTKGAEDLATGRQEIIEGIGVSCRRKPALRWVIELYDEWAANGLPTAKI